ncbi:hypothetical protein [Streptomyces iconiensis]|uniref:Uncharacterized protein n=1 Tax=Streptomyces iconiensis TaxID=1384038 RepID=A0ABT7A4H0_9ACTN|nr:hypothetical protein [Streptomyces iconiensis]MDJ1136230.1 hypothetical protein [Streptomyces iconiensis]
MSEISIPGALADFLAGTNLATGADDHDAARKATREALDAGRRSRGRTLIITPTIPVLHVISEYAETLLAATEATPAERRAARLWIERAGHAKRTPTTPPPAPALGRAPLTDRSTNHMDTSDQQPTGPDEEPRTLHYKRTDTGKEPTHPAGQQAAVEGMLAARGLLPEDRPATAAHNRRRYERIAAQLNAEGIPVETPSAQLMTRMYALFDEYDRETVAARALAGDPNPTDADALEYVYEIAERYAQRDKRPGYLDQLADELSLDAVRALRLAGEAAQAVTPRVIVEEAARGKTPPRIAEEVGLTTSRVYGILREERARKDSAAFFRAGIQAERARGTSPRDSLAKWAEIADRLTGKERQDAERILATFREEIERAESNDDDQ